MILRSYRHLLWSRNRGLILTSSVSSSPTCEKSEFHSISLSRALGSCICIMFRPNPTAWIWLACSPQTWLFLSHRSGSPPLRAPRSGPVRRSAGLRDESPACLHTQQQGFGWMARCCQLPDPLSKPSAATWICPVPSSVLALATTWLACSNP